MTHSHDHHHHDHDHHSINYNRAFLIGTILNTGFVIIELRFGFWTHSLSLLADGGHNLSDVFGLLLAWSGNILAQHPPTQRYTYGLRRSSILAALFNALILLLVMGGIAWDAIQRLFHPSPISGVTIIIVASVGVVINTVTALLFMSGRRQDLNIRGVFLHMASDALVSCGVILTGLAILFTGWLWFDPLVSLLIVAVIVVGTWQLLRDSLSLALDGVPLAIEPQAVRTYLKELPGVAQIHDLHIWAMSTQETALTVHLVMPNGFPGDAFLSETCQQLYDLFGIEHPTLQIETGDSNYPCVLAPDHRV
ncbi:cation diffusion facilitator family transporter [Aphanothece sacrum]|uniref:Cation efflux system protein n=1 Tax=Aphanothece sacrum FPU1 TaxID=1920663 RepID=A0A401IE72_APHSA|nr:cation diffusion facilitator family transporter [Aphanothece sacrum]GBF79534.1 cation efflux system protein [Aphanothece sacrum FPU1]GBF83925.1 cation efflux system protein [Aphanothece sacrum FPU3]